MKTRLRSLFAAAVLATGLAAALVAGFLAPPALAATRNQPVGSPVVVVPFLIAGQRTANVTAVLRFQMPFAAQLIGVSASARASGGTSPTLTVDVLEAGTTVLSAPIAVTAGAVAEGTVADAALADEAAITVNLAIGGTSPTWDDITVLLTLVRQ
jgi:hypothetical protein